MIAVQHGLTAMKYYCRECVLAHPEDEVIVIDTMTQSLPVYCPEHQIDLWAGQPHE